MYVFNIIHNLYLKILCLYIAAKKAFLELGEYLQRARQQDYWDTFSLYLETMDEDPATNDKELARKLTSNRIEGEKKLTAVFEKYSKKQEEVNDQVVSSETSTEDESEDDDVNRDEDEDKEKDNDSDLSLRTLNNEDNDSNENTEGEVQNKEKVQHNILSTDRNKESTTNANTISVSRDTDRIASAKTENKEKSDKNAEAKASTREADATVSKNENNKTTTSEEKVRRSPISNVVATSSNVSGTVAKTPIVSSSSTTNCADITDRTEGS